MAQPGRYVILRTNSDTDFRAGINQNAAIFADFPLLGCGPMYWVEAIQVISVQNLAWELWFFDRETAAIPADLEVDGYRGRKTFATADGLQIGATGTFHYSSEKLSIPGECIDYRLHLPTKYPQLHVALVNRSAGAKSADDAGAIAIQLILNPGLGGS